VVAQSIHSSQSLNVGGIKQWIQMMGLMKKIQSCFFFMGGRANSVISYANKFTDQLQKHFVVVLWDQREAGETKKLILLLKTLTVDLFESDAVEVINYLRQRFQPG